MRLRLLVVLTLVLALAGCGGGRDVSSPAPSSTSRTTGGYEIAHPDAAPDFRLTDQDGRVVRLAGQRGRVVVVTFLYTNCPDVCPLIADNLNRALRELGPRRRDVRMLAVSVDPRGDTARSVRRFVRAHRLLPQFRYLTGSKADLERVWKAYDVIAVAQNPELVDHSVATVLVDREGMRRFLYPADFKAAAVVNDVKAVLAS